MPRRRPSTAIVALALVPLTLAASGCIGAIDRAEFEAEVRSRGGGVSTVWVDDALDAAADRLDVPAAENIEFLTLTLDGTNRVLTVTARRGDRPDFVDSVVVREGEVVSVSPLQDADQLPLDEITIPLGSVPIDRLEELADEALDQFGEDDGFVSTINVALTNGAPTVTFSLESARRTGTAVFGADGTLIEMTP